MHKIITWKNIFIVLLLVLVCFFVINQGLSYFYRAEFLLAPCKLCTELNPHLEECFIQPRYKDDLVVFNYSTITLRNVSAT